jgi:solute carrier family 25 S-adenosylmethionine transporter 26
MNDVTLSLMVGGISGTIREVLLFPFDTIKVRVQSSQGFQRAGGFLNLHRGILSATLAASPITALFFGIYNATNEKLKRGGEQIVVQHIEVQSLGKLLGICGH